MLEYNKFSKLLFLSNLCYVIMLEIVFLQCVNKLSFETLKVVKGRHTSKTSALVRACSAYCFITIPSVSSPVSRLQLLLISGQTALANQCFGQGE